MTVFCPEYAHAVCEGCDCICHTAAERVRASRELGMKKNAAASNSGIWQCTIGEVPQELVPDDSDFPMQEALKWAFHEVTGQWPEFIFSGWGAVLTESQHEAVARDRQRALAGDDEYEKTFQNLVELSEELGLYDDGEGAAAGD